MNGLRNQPTVLVWDTDPSRVNAVCEIISRCGARGVPVEPMAGEPIRSRPAFRAASLSLVALDSGLRDEALRIVPELSALGNSVICYADDISSWPVGRQCKLLLGGVDRLLSSGDSKFDRRLLDSIKHLLGSYFDNRDEHDEQLALASRLGIVGHSQAILSVLSWVRKVSILSDLQVLITGETGTGKEVIAQSLHRLDPKRSKGPFIALNCSTVSATLAESELFGHQHGAFTGSDGRREGAFRAAAGGVLFLDEIGELPLPLQAKLLRVLQEKRVRGVGEDQEVDVDVRVIAATHRDLPDMVQRGEFRADLYHRLRVLNVYLPPLRARREDIGPLAEHFVVKHRDLRRGETSVLNAEYVKALAALELPGNVRQLENIVRWTLVNKSDSDPLSLRDLPAEVWAELAGDEEPPASRQIASSGDLNSQLEEVLEANKWSLASAIEHCERVMLKAALRRTAGNQSRAAQLIGMTPRSVYNKIRKYDLSDTKRRQR